VLGAACACRRRNDTEAALRDGSPPRTTTALISRTAFGSSPRPISRRSTASTPPRRRTSRSGRPCAGRCAEAAKRARSVVQKIGSKVLDHVRNNTLHVPSPKTDYTPSSDEKHRNALASMSDRPVRDASQLARRPAGNHAHVRGRYRPGPGTGEARGRRQRCPRAVRDHERTALSLYARADARVVTYLDAAGSYLRTPRLIEERRPNVQASRRARARSLMRSIAGE
jgi:hypothetical protein